MDTFRSRTPRDLTAFRKFGAGVPIQDSGPGFGMTNPNGHDLEKLPVVLLHGTSGKSEDCSQGVEQLASHRSVIRPSYAEPVAGTNEVNVPRISDFADRVLAA